MCPHCVGFGRCACVATRRRDAAADLHFLGCPFSPGSITEICTSPGVLSARGRLLEYARSGHCVGCRRGARRVSISVGIVGYSPPVCNALHCCMVHTSHNMIDHGMKWHRIYMILLQSSASQYNTLHSIALQYITPYHITLHCSTLQYIT